jgi:hypothetical protein
MQTKSLIAMAAVGMTAAIAIPTIAFGNARSNQGDLSYLRVAQTPYLAQMSGAKELPATPGNPNGSGTAAVTFDIPDRAQSIAEVCWDLTYSGITTPTAVQIEPAAGGTPLVQFTPAANLGATSATGCVVVLPATVDTITATPSNYYVNVITAGFATGAIRGQLAPGPAPAGEAHLLPLPLRAYDSRDNSGVKIAASETRMISLATGKDALGASFIAVPPGATAAMVTLTATSTSGNGGFLKLYSAAITEPATSSINWSTAGENVAVSTTVAVDANGRIKVTAGANSTHFVIDVIGYLF